MTDSPLELYYWRSALEILSVDIARPLYPELGIHIVGEEKLRKAVREALCGGPWMHPPSECRFTLLPGLGPTSVAALMQRLDSDIGAGTAAELEYWVRYVACTDDENPWALYEDLFEVWASSLRRSGRDHFGLSADAAAIEARFRLASDRDRPTAVLDEQRAQPLSGWDAAVLTTDGLIPEGSDFFPIVDAVLLTIGMARFQDFWQWLVSFIGPADLSSIQSAVRRRADGKGVPYCPAEALPLRGELGDRRDVF